MSDADALLAAIAADPDDDTPRLAYADWLDEHDEPVRAEFIRVQVEIARLEHLPRAELNRHVALFKHNQALIDGRRAELLGPLAGPLAETFLVFRRGFLSYIDAGVGAFLGFAPLVAALRPLPRVRVTQVAARLADFARCRELGVVAEVSAYGHPVGPERPTEDDIRAAAARLTRLSDLDLEGCALDDGFCELFGRLDLPALASLDLSQNEVTDGGVEALLRTHHPRRLRRLILGGNDITDVGAVALATGWPTGGADRLKELNLQFTNIGHIGHRALLARFGGRVELF